MRSYTTFKQILDTTRYENKKQKRATKTTRDD